ncbi:MAG: alpha/beta fold hydrolase [Desulfurococcales archaeon]|nr:alpha/beta fold hydrolase [Desulfurococcales archaeon]
MPYIRTNDIITYYEVYGEGYPLVLIHGAWSDHGVWRPQIEYFSRSYKVIVYDLRGLGRTDRSKTREYSLELFVDDLKALLEALSIEKPIICGRSLGGLIAQAYAIKYPRLKALILANTSPITPLSLSDKIRRYLEKPVILAYTSIAHLIGVKRFVNLGLKMIKLVHGEKRISIEEDMLKQIQETLVNINEDEFFKLFKLLTTPTPRHLKDKSPNTHYSRRT